MTDKELMAEYKTLLVTSAQILISAENAMRAGWEAENPNQIAGTIVDVPAQLKQVTTLIDTVLILHQCSGNPILYPANVNGKRVKVTIPED